MVDYPNASVLDWSEVAKLLTKLSGTRWLATVSGEVFYYISQRAERRVAVMPQAVVDQRVVAVYVDRNRRVDRLADGFK